MRRGHLPPFDWKLFKLGSVSVRDIRKNVPILQVGGSTLAPPIPPEFRIVLLHKLRLSNHLIPQLYIMNVYCYMFKVAIVKLMSGTELSNAVKNALLI